MRHSALATATLAVLLAACSPTPAPVVVNPGVPASQAYVQPQDPQQYAQQQPYVQQQPVIVQAAPQPVIVQGGNNSGAGDFVAGALVGGLVGHAMGSSYGGGYNGGPNRTVVNNTTIVNHASSTTVAPTAPAQKQRIDVRSSAGPRAPAAAPRAPAAGRVSVRSPR